jgi:hypothetical protein
MFNKPLQQFVNVVAGGIATLRIPAENFCLVGVKLVLSGTTFTKTHIDSVKVKVGQRVLWDLTGADVNAINNYKNGADNQKYLLIDFTERKQAIFPVKEIGGLDLMSLISVGEVFIEIKINAAAVNPAIQAIGNFEAPQGNPAVLKFVSFPYNTSAAGKFTLPVQLRGALLKRLWLRYTGTNWGATTDGNVSRLECKKNGLVFFDEKCTDNRFTQGHFNKVPQANYYVADFLSDDNHDAHITTMRKVKDASGATQLLYDSFEFNAFITDAGGSTVTCIAEVLDSVGNL